MEKEKKYYIYILRCRDLSLYTGITIDVKKRYQKHIAGKGAKYTKSKGVERLELCFSCLNRSEASKIEYFIKKMSRKKKEEIILKFDSLQEEIEGKLGIRIKKEKI